MDDPTAGVLQLEAQSGLLSGGDDELFSLFKSWGVGNQTLPAAVSNKVAVIILRAHQFFDGLSKTALAIYQLAFDTPLP